MDIAVRIMNKGTGFNITICIDMQISSSTGDTSVHIFPVVPEIHGEQLFGVAEFANLTIHKLTLLCCHHQIRNRIHAYRHISKVPCELRSLVNQEIRKFLTADYFGVGSCIAKGGAKRQLFASEKVHGLNHLLIGSLPASGIRCFLKSLNADGRHKIFDAQHLVGKVLIYQGTVGKRKEFTITVFLTKTDNILFPHQRLPAGIDIEINAKLFPLLNDAVQGIIVHGKLVAILCCPTACAF